VLNNVTVAERELTFGRDGAELVPNAVDERTLRAILDATSDLSPERAGTRLYGIDTLAPILSAEGPAGKIAAGILGDNCRPVRALLFDKSAATNWSLGWHQDRTIVVEERIEVAGFGPWTVKDGLLHVTPPFDLLAAMITLRIHLDPVPATNAPLLVAPGSHRRGRIAERDIQQVVSQHGIAACLAEAGDIWLYATPILHASEAATRPARRRVLQVDYAATERPSGLAWLGV
jgi:hypothetical protein